MPSPRFRPVIDEAVVRVLSRASDSRGLTVGDVTPRVESALEKYLFKANPDSSASEVKEFIDGIRSDDLCLILACEKGDERAWSDLVSEFDGTVRSAARKMCTNSADAEDLASSIWAELYGLKRDADGRVKSKLSYYSGKGSLGGWLRAIVSQLAIDEFRKQAKFVQVEEDREFENLAAEASVKEVSRGLVSTSESPEAELDEKRTAADVMASISDAVSQLPDEDRLMLKLYYFDELKLKEVAATFGFHEATASRRLVKIQARLRELVGENLRKQRGWTEEEIDRNLAEAASKLGLGVEQLFKLLIFAVLVQEALGVAVQ